MPENREYYEARIQELSQATRDYGEATEDAKSQRNVAIGEGKRAGLTLWELVRLSGLGLTQVQRIVVGYDTGEGL